MTLEQRLADLTKLISESRSPGLFSESGLLTERLLAHPAKFPLPPVRFASKPAEQKNNRVEVAARLIAAYHKALDDEPASALKRQGEDLWTGLLRNELPQLIECVETRNPAQLAEYLLQFGRSFVWFGGITTCVDGYNRDLGPDNVALTYLDKLVCLAESLGVLPLENPESGPWGENLRANIDVIAQQIEDALGIEISPPLGVIHTDGVETSRGVLHYRHINSLYMAARISVLNRGFYPVCELGGGIGIGAMYARRLGYRDYTILDLPISCLLAGHYLIHAVGADEVSLYGEEQKKDAIKILPYWKCMSLPDKSYGIIVNQDSLPEIDDNLIRQYLVQFSRIGAGYVLSINHEYFYPRTAHHFFSSHESFEKLYRSKCWVREGYVEEVYRINS
ncbi:hypothetical protein OGR47_19355 (plasmid) [Methylocystis sp. MJC1]|jgi:hypothetical protein|uniref:hypothetical protein n=1 Tax=Methylocystis sp. MJC1 TaxID=2654282 RepID=UPI0013EAAED5|nr:hypothetical protein [Methylocystis sp. MJC1]KAF2988883.1 hypothetical protein MJC1_04043 [Methylocystis sp. MJC1]MBU6529100.1 hypothetical protein [Methylocystis sp. MJC1]UZX14038.1 hypothetical protein OGR47_19355 [Methylocystis sp. MJC1]